MEDVEGEAFVAKNPIEKGARLRYTVRDAYKEFHIALKSMGKMYKVTFQKQVKALEQSAEDISNGVHSVIFDPPF